MLEPYVDAFAQFLRTGERGAVETFCEPDADPSYLEVYRNGFHKACVDALRSNFPSVRSVVGEDSFAALARAYVDAHPPRARTLVEYGAQFADFTEAHRDSHGLDYLSSIAVLDAAWLAAYFAADAPSLDGKAVARLAEEGTDVTGLRVALAPSARLCEISHAVLAIWQALRDGTLEAPLPAERRPQTVLVWRSGDTVSSRALDQPERVFVCALSGGRTLGGAVEAVTARNAGFDVAGGFAALLENGLLTLATNA